MAISVEERASKLTIEQYMVLRLLYQVGNMTVKNMLKHLPWLDIMVERVVTTLEKKKLVAVSTIDFTRCLWYSTIYGDDVLGMARILLGITKL